jgi:hypothetical protein
MKKILCITVCVIEFLAGLYFMICMVSIHAGMFTKNIVIPFIVSGIVSLLFAAPAVKCGQWLDEH